MEAILYELNQGVATLTLNRPAQKNALGEVLRNEVADVDSRTSMPGSPN